jgi:hypothetical protein
MAMFEALFFFSVFSEIWMKENPGLLSYTGDTAGMIKDFKFKFGTWELTAAENLPL